MKSPKYPEPRDNFGSAAGRPLKHWVDMVQTRTWHAAVQVASGGMSNSRLDAEVVKGTEWEQSEISLRVRLFESALMSQPSRGLHAGSRGIDVVELAEARWPGTQAVFEHPLWSAWQDLPQTFSAAVRDVEEGLQFLGLERDLSEVGSLGILPTREGQREEVLEAFKRSVNGVMQSLGVLDQLLLSTILFREADILRLPTSAFLMDVLCEAIASFTTSPLGDEEDVDELETALLFARWDIQLDDETTISNSLDALAPIVSSES